MFFLIYSTQQCGNNANHLTSSKIAQASLGNNSRIYLFRNQFSTNSLFSLINFLRILYIDLYAILQNELSAALILLRSRWLKKNSWKPSAVITMAALAAAHNKSQWWENCYAERRLAMINDSSFFITLLGS